MWSPTGKPVAPLSFADSLRERRDLVVRHPDRKRSGLKPWLSAVGVNLEPLKLSLLSSKRDLFSILDEY